MENPPKIIPAEESIRILEANLDQFVNCIRETFIEYSTGSAQNPLRTWLETDSTSGLICMPGFVASKNALAVKLLTYGERRFGGNVALFNPTDGSLCALLDAESITEYRTAAMSVVASMALAPRAKRLGVYGAGVQARRHALMLVRCLPIEEIFVWNHLEERGQKLVRELKEFGLRARYCHDPAEAAQELIVTATNSEVPILSRKWLPARCHVNCIGAPRKEHQELDADIMKDADIVLVDSRESALNESGDILRSGVTVTEIGEFLQKTEENYQEKHLTVFKSLGIAVQDAATAKFVWDRL